MRVKRSLTSAKILGPRWRCWRCKGRRQIVVSDKGDVRLCPSCNGRDSTSAAVHGAGPSTEVDTPVATRRAA
jgi:hypothetical protein